MTITNSNYYSDISHISHSMLCSLAQYNRFGTRTYTPEYYYARHVLGTVPFEKSDAMLVGTIVDEYFSR